MKEKFNTRILTKNLGGKVWFHQNDEIRKSKPFSLLIFEASSKSSNGFLTISGSIKKIFIFTFFFYREIFTRKKTIVVSLPNFFCE